MKKKVKLLGVFCQMIFPIKIVNYYISFKRNLLTGYYSKLFKSFGSNSIIGSSFFLIGGKFITIGKNVSIGKRGCFTAWDSYENESFKPEILIGDNVSVGDDCHITAINKIVIGSNVLMGKKITITDNSHGRGVLNEKNINPIYKKLYSKGPVFIGDYVWIGDKVTILPGVSIGKNSIIGANSVVTKNIPANTVTAGVPAKIIKHIGSI